MEANSHNIAFQTQEMSQSVGVDFVSQTLLCKKELQVFPRYLLLMFTSSFF